MGSADAEVHSTQTFLQSQSLQTFKRVFFRINQEQCIESLIEWIFMVKELHSSLTSLSPMQSVECNSVEHPTTGLRSVDTGNLMDKHGFSHCQENGSHLTWMRELGVEEFQSHYSCKWYADIILNAMDEEWDVAQFHIFVKVEDETLL